MASKRELKKDIRVVTEQIIIDALEVASTLKDEDQKKEVLDIIVEVVNLHNELISRTNHPDGKASKKLVKAYYNSIIDDLLASSNKAYEKLSAFLPN